MIEIEQRAQNAKDYFKSGYNCCQAVLLAYNDFTNLDKETLATLGAPLGGGMGRLREVCGTVTGMFIVSGFCEKASDPQDREAKKRAYATVQSLSQSFKEMHGSIVCRELLSGEILKDKSSVPELRTDEYYKKRPCAELVADAARIVGQYIEKLRKTNNGSLKA
ncbi:MAG: C-GCAxxG-C-C family protein [Rikenellaceae bacterium]